MSQLFLLTFFQIYIPILYGLKYTWLEDKARVQNLLKYTVINVLLWGIKYLVSFLIQQLVLQVVLIFPYSYLTIYDYTYAASLYDLMITPLSQSIRDKMILQGKMIKLQVEMNKDKKKTNQNKRMVQLRNLLDPQELFLIKEQRQTA